METDSGRQIKKLKCLTANKGVKRKFYTTTQSANSFDPLFTPAESTSMETDSGRQMKKLKCLTESESRDRVMVV
jgi:hypothetical protein